MNVQHRPAPCLRCRRQKKRCDQVKPACERCVLMGKELECQYPYEEKEHQEPQEPTPQQQVQFQNQHGSVLSHVITALETPLDDFEDRDWTVQDPDLMASQADWLLMFTFLTTNERSGQLRLSVDVQRFLATFFTQPAALRLTFCAFAAHFASPAVAEGVALAYYVRARKAVLRAPPTYQTAQAFCWIFGFSYWKGQPAVGAPFFKAALALAAALRLAVDPHALDLSESEKEERRRLYWNLYYAVKIAQSTSNDFDAVNLSVDKVNPPRAITEPYVAHISFDSFPSVCAVIDLIVVIRRHYFTGPGTLSNVLDNPGWQSVAQRLREVHGKVPIHYILVPESAEMITDADRSRFINQLYAIPRHEIRFLLGMNLNILSSISLLHRSKLFLSGLNSCTPTSLDPDSKKIISTAITQALQSAHRIACLISFLLEMISDPTQKTYFGSTLFEWNTFLTNPIFEAIIVFWFIQCRMNPEWWGFVERGNCPRDVVRQRILDMISVLENAASYQKELLAPHVVCVKAMLDEMDGVAGQQENNSDTQLELGMKVVSLGGNDEITEQQEPMTKEPWCFLGLLGLEVAGGVRWRASKEEDWRLFWLLN